MTFPRAVWEATKATPLLRLVVFAVFSLGGLSVSSIWPALDFLATAPNWSRYVLVFSPLLLFLSGAWLVVGRAWQKVEDERQKLANQLRPKLDILFEERRPYHESEQAHRRDEITHKHIFRIGVHNPSGTAITDTCVELQQIRPNTVIVLPVRLHLRNDPQPLTDIPQNAYRSRFLLTPGGTEFVDVIMQTILEKQGRKTGGELLRVLHISHTYNIINLSYEPAPYYFTIAVFGKETTPCHKRFVVNIDNRGFLTFHPC